MVILHGVCGRREGEEIIDRCRDFEGALITVTHDAVDPFRIDDAGPHHTAYFILKRADFGCLRPGVVVVIDCGLRARKMAYRRGSAALKLIIVVGIEKIVFPVVLVVDNRLDAA